MRNIFTRTPIAVSVLLLLTMMSLAVALPAQAQTSGSANAVERVLYSFTGSPSTGDGALPRANLFRDAAGNLYGTTFWGGNAPHSQYCSVTGCGTVFKLDSNGHQTVLYKFMGTNGDGYDPEGGVVLDAAGNIYGTTTGGGDQFATAGVVYEIDPSGHETVLYTFQTGDGNGGPTASLLLDSHGNLFGTTTNGGSHNAGSVFKLDVNRNYSELHTFTGGADGGVPYRAGVIVDSVGNLYGVTSYGGAHNNGTVYKVTPTGSETVLYSFTGGSDGANPLGTLVRDNAGNFYGVTNTGGANGNGVVFRLSATGQQKVLYTFGPGLDGQPLSGVVLDTQGNLYGTTSLGGANHRGSVFKLDSSNTLSTLYSFAGNDGGRPYGGLVNANNTSVLYGTTVDGGTYSAGTVFELTP